MQSTPRQQRPRRIQDRVSLGIACCRVRAGTPEILLVCKRYTYAYSVFTQGKYNSSVDAEIIELFNGMTLDEKVDIMSLNFGQIWYRLWLNNNPRSRQFFLARNKFENTFASADGSARLQRLIARSATVGRIWEIPKGRRKGKAEFDIHCAMREFGEETNLSPAIYKVIPGCSRSYSYIDLDVRYTNQYYIAITGDDAPARIDFANRTQIEEISDIRWMSMRDIELIDESGRLKPFIAPILNCAKKHITTI